MNYALRLPDYYKHEIEAHALGMLANALDKEPLLWDAL